MELNVRADVKEVLAMLNETQKSVIPKAASRAINKTMTTVNAQAAREIKKDIGGKISISEIKASMAINKTNPKALYAALYAKGRRIPIIKIDPAAHQDGSGVNYKTGKGRGHIPHAFVATMRSGHRGVFKRKSSTRLPIQELHGPSIPKVFINNVIMEAMERIAKERWAKVFQQEINFELSKFR